MNKYLVKYETGKEVAVFANDSKAAQLKAEKYGVVISVRYFAKRMPF